MHPLNVSEQLTRWIDGAGNQSFILNISVPCPLSIRSSVSLSVSNYVKQYVSRSVYQSVCLSVSLPGSQSFKPPSDCQSDLKSVSFFQCFYQSLCEFVTVFSQSATFCQSVYQLVCQPDRPSVRMPVCLSANESVIHSSVGLLSLFFIF